MKLGEWYGMLSVALLDSSGQPFLTEGSFFALQSHERGGCPMVTYSDLIQIGILIVGIIGLFMSHKKK